MGSRARKRFVHRIVQLAVPESPITSSSQRFLLAPVKVATVISTINKQMGIVIEQCVNPLDVIVKQVVGGVWKGDGANRFVEEMTNIVRPQLTKLSDSIGATGPQISKAMEIMQEADRLAANRMANGAGSLMDDFKYIYR